MQVKNKYVVFAPGKDPVLLTNPPHGRELGQHPTILINPDVSRVVGVATHHWKLHQSQIWPMTEAERAEVDLRHKTHGPQKAPVPEPRDSAPEVTPAAPRVPARKPLSFNWALVTLTIGFTLLAVIIGLGLGWLLFSHL